MLLPAPSALACPAHAHSQTAGLQHYLPPEPDLIVLDYAVNNNAGPAAKPWVHNHPRSFERLMRRLARLPSRPLVLGFQLHSFNENHVRRRCCAALRCAVLWPVAVPQRCQLRCHPAAALWVHAPAPPCSPQSNGTFHLSGEDAMGALFQYYRVPYISFRRRAAALGSLIR